ncbi:sulfonate transport system substrate-binding protein [Paenibacillus sp. UNC496MF]|uniref:ABC transporter substrate-binding protein n=1 Tax=Paenibacillus sp. UNC496MF TaxID=1502753 RepID=UPI0008EB5B47|nr:ABC transporter substrate-binding protein [Paenibacillus sp. UNC496MF]SFI87284.1 sulfonate transport system substrate-binding protein [Paenibacillus sp. UNC496MF]
MRTPSAVLSGSRKLSLLVAASLVLLLAACGNGGGGGKAGADGGSSADAGSGAAADAGGAPKSNIPDTLNYGYIGLNDLNLPTGAEGWGFHTGLIQEELKKYGITKVNLIGFPNGPDQTESLISGRLDFGSLGDTPAILARSTGAKTRLITQASTDSIGYLIGKKNGPMTVQELEGKTIAIQKGSFMHRYVVGLLEQAGVKHYKLVHMLRPDGEAALARGEVDAMTNSGVNALKQLEQGYIHLDDASTHPDLVGTSATVVSEDYLKKFPDFPKVWNEIRLKALADLKRHEDEYYKLAAQIQKTTPELFKQVSPVSTIKDTPFTGDGIQLLDGTKHFLVQQKLATKDFDVNAWILRADR